MTAGEQAKSDCRIGVDYPAPIVEDARERETALRLFEMV